jgi:signal transduction histidine kinase
MVGAATIGVTAAIREHEVVADTSVASVIRLFLTTPFTRRAWAEVTYVLVVAPIAGLGFTAVVGLLFVSAMLSLLVVGVVVSVPLLALTLLGARHVGGVVHRSLAAALLGEQVPEPPVRPPPSRGLRGWLGWSFGDAAAWRAMAFLIISFPVMMAAVYATVLAGAVGLIFLTNPLVRLVFDPTNVDADGVVRHSSMQFGDVYIDTWPRSLGIAALGVLVLLVTPWVVRGFVSVERLLVRNLLGPGQMTARLRDLEETRSQAVDDSAAALRRIERDLHDGTQARLVALAMQLDMAREELADDDSRARELVDTAHRNATDAITELRQVTRSIHPPILDRGLDSALATLAAGSAVPTLLSADIRARPSAAIETIAYFCVAELLANVAKHSHANRATVVVATQEGDRLRLQVGDDGVGGAAVADTGSGGLAGLVDRLRTVDGRLRIDSPPGGPTLVTVDLPANA